MQIFGLGVQFLLKVDANPEILKNIDRRNIYTITVCLCNS